MKTQKKKIKLKNLNDKNMIIKLTCNNLIMKIMQGSFIYNFICFTDKYCVLKTCLTDEYIR